MVTGGKMSGRGGERRHYSVQVGGSNGRQESDKELKIRLTIQ